MPSVTSSLQTANGGTGFVSAMGQAAFVAFAPCWPRVSLSRDCILVVNKSGGCHRMPKSIYACHGIPVIVLRDNRSQFSCEASADFTQNHSFQHTTGSPHHPRANGEAKRAVQTVGRLLKKAEGPYLAPLVYCDTPGPTGPSPAELIVGRHLHTQIPVYPALLALGQVNNELATRRNCHVKERQMLRFSGRHAAQWLLRQHPGAAMWVKDRKRSGEVLRQADTPRSYWVRTPRGEVRRNRRALNKLPISSGQEKVMWLHNA